MTARVPTQPGMLVDATYEIVALVGRGGMARVWLGRDVRLDKLWAVKEVTAAPGDGHAEALRQAAIGEAQFMKRLDHPAIPRVVDICDEGDAVFVVMDFVNGRSLGRMLRERGRPFAQEQVVAWALALCDVLAYLHGLDPPVVYRDLKPDNVMLRDDGSLRLVDFGIATEWHAGEETAVRALGTPGYAAPEQLGRGRPFDPRADVYALGATVYSLLTGHVPRDLGGGAVDFELRALRAWDAGLSEGLERVVARATREDPDERYQSVLEMAYDLRHHGELTNAHREGLRRRVRSFRRRVTAAGACGALSVACLLGAAAVRAESYEGLMHAAALASAEETGGDDGVAAASPAERAYAQAVACDPARIDAWREILGLYKEDLELSAGEAARWSALFAEHGRAVRGAPGYARLCFDAGVLHLCYYEGSAGEALAPARARRAAEWFSLALDAPGDGLGEELRRTAEAYLVIAEFHDRVSQAALEGSGGDEAYRSTWEAFEHGVSALSDADEPVVRLRLYQACFEAIASPAYLRGFWRAGVPRASVESLLREVVGRSRTLSVEFGEGTGVLGRILDEIVGGEDAARSNVAATYGNPVAAGTDGGT